MPDARRLGGDEAQQGPVTLTVRGLPMSPTQGLSMVAGAQFGRATITLGESQRIATTMRVLWTSPHRLLLTPLRHQCTETSLRASDSLTMPPGQRRTHIAGEECPPTVNRSAPPPLGSPGSGLDGCGRGRRCLPSAGHRRAGKSVCARRSRRSPLRPASG